MNAIGDTCYAADECGVTAREQESQHHNKAGEPEESDVPPLPTSQVDSQSKE
jgi:hypothetical protein